MDKVRTSRKFTVVLIALITFFVFSAIVAVGIFVQNNQAPDDTGAASQTSCVPASQCNTSQKCAGWYKATAGSSCGGGNINCTCSANVVGPGGACTPNEVQIDECSGSGVCCSCQGGRCLGDGFNNCDQYCAFLSGNNPCNCTFGQYIFEDCGNGCPAGQRRRRACIQNNQGGTCPYEAGGECVPDNQCGSGDPCAAASGRPNGCICNFGTNCASGSCNAGVCGNPTGSSSASASTGVCSINNPNAVGSFIQIGASCPANTASTDYYDILVYVEPAPPGSTNQTCSAAGTPEQADSSIQGTPGGLYDPAALGVACGNCVQIDMLQGEVPPGTTPGQGPYGSIIYTGDCLESSSSTVSTTSTSVTSSSSTLTSTTSSTSTSTGPDVCVSLTQTSPTSTATYPVGQVFTYTATYTCSGLDLDMTMGVFPDGALTPVGLPQNGLPVSSDFNALTSTCTYNFEWTATSSDVFAGNYDVRLLADSTIGSLVSTPVACTQDIVFTAVTTSSSSTTSTVSSSSSTSSQPPADVCLYLNQLTPIESSTYVTGQEFTYEAAFTCGGIDDNLTMVVVPAGETIPVGNPTVITPDSTNYNSGTNTCTYTFSWTASDLTSGDYEVRLLADGTIASMITTPPACMPDLAMVSGSLSSSSSTSLPSSPSSGTSSAAGVATIPETGFLDENIGILLLGALLLGGGILANRYGQVMFKLFGTRGLNSSDATSSIVDKFITKFDLDVDVRSELLPGDEKYQARVERHRERKLKKRNR